MLLAALALLAASSPTQEPAVGWRIRVLEDSPHGLQPAAGARVRPWFGEGVPLPEVTLDARGRARIDLSSLALLPPIDLSSGRLHASIQQPGYGVERIEATLSWGESLHVQGEHDLCLRPAAELSGRVLDAVGRPARGATVALQVDGPDGKSWHPKTTRTTDVHGVFELPLPAQVSGTLVAFHPALGSGSLAVWSPRTELEVRLAPQLPAVRGRVVSDRGQPLPNWPVVGSRVIRSSQPIVTRIKTWTDAQGAFELHLPEDAAWHLHAGTDWRGRPLESAQVVRPGAQNVLLIASGLFAWVRVFDESGRPTQAGYRVEAVEDTPGGPRPVEGVSRRWMRWPELQRPWVDGADGSMVGFAGPGLFAIQASGRTLAGARFDVRQLVRLDGSRDLQPVDLVLRRSSPRVPLEIRDLDGAELPPWSAFLYCAETSAPMGELTEQGVPFRSCMATTYSPARVTPGSYRLRMVPSGFGLPSEHHFEVSPGEPVRLRLPRPHLGGRLAIVRSAPNGKFEVGLALDLRRIGDGLVSGPWQLNAPPRSPGPSQVWSLGERIGASHPSILLAPGGWEFFLRDARGVLLQHGTFEIVAGEETLARFDA